MRTFRRVLCSALVSLGFVLGCFVGAAWAQGVPQHLKTNEIIKDFAGRTIPSIAHELINLELPAEGLGYKPAALPGWEHIDGSAEPSAGVDSPHEDLRDSGWYLNNLTKQSTSVALVRRVLPDKSWKITEVFARTRDERLTEFCENKGHKVPAGHQLVGIVREGDPRKPPVPRRPSIREQLKYREENQARSHPRACIGDTQIARIAALLNLETGKLSRYTAKPLTCVSPFFDPCLPD